MDFQARARPEETIGQRLRRLRLERGLSQRELAEPGVSYAYISRIEAGVRRPSVKALRKLARTLGVSAEYLETGSEIRDVEERELRLADAELKLRLAQDSVDAEKTLASILEEALQAGDSASATRARIGLGLAAHHQGRHAEAVGRLEEAIASAPVSPAAHPDVYATLGRSYAALGTPERAVELFERCLSEVTEETPDDLAAQVRFASYLSYALSDLGDLARAEAVLADALRAAERVADPYTRVRLYWSLARVSAFEGQSSKALSYVRRAIALLEATEDTLHLARAHLLCGWIMNGQGRAEEAGAHLELAERLFGAHPEPGDLASLRTEQAKRAARLGAADEAVERAREALALLGDSDPGEQGGAWWALAEGLALQGDVKAADEAFRRAVDLLAEHGPRRRDAAEAYRAWGKFLRKAGRESEALDVLERAADLAVRDERAQTVTER